MNGDVMFSGDQVVSKTDLLRALPPEWAEDVSVDLHKRIQNHHRKLVVLDDDPTGAQAMHSAPVLTHWNHDVLRSALLNDSTLFFVVSNTRGLPQEEAVAVTGEIVMAVADVATECGVVFDVLVRGDSTLRGHYPHELNVVREVLGARGQHFDGVILCPFFLEGGRLTAFDVQWVTDGEQLIPAGQTEYARDRTFGYSQSNLRDWVVEKTRGMVLRNNVVSIGLNVIREQGPQGVCKVLMDVRDGQPVVVNAVSYRDLDVFVSGLLDAEDAGKRFLFRTAASFLKVRSGSAERGLLRGSDFGMLEGVGGLVVVGSYIQKSTAQLTEALAIEGVVGVELLVAKVLNRQDREREILRVTGEIECALELDKDVIVFTSRNQEVAGDLDAGKKIGTALVDVIERLEVRPRYVMVKGGNTAISIVRDGLHTQSAWALGQILPGVPVWQLGVESRLPQVPCVVFPGNVGEADSLAKAIHILREARDAR